MCMIVTLTDTTGDRMNFHVEAPRKLQPVADTLKVDPNNKSNNSSSSSSSDSSSSSSSTHEEGSSAVASIP